MKTLCTVTVTLLLSLLCVVLPREVWAMENAMLEQIKSAADAAVERMKVLQTKEAKTDEQKQLARELLIYAKANAEAASVLLRLPSPEGGGISQEQAENMQKIGSLSRAVLKTAAVIAQGDTVTAGQDLDKLAAMTDGLLVLEEDTITLEEMLAIKAAADEAVEEAKLRLEQATTPEERELAEQLLAYAEGNAEIAAAFLQTLLEGGSIARNLAEECAAAAQAVKEGTAAMVAGDLRGVRAMVGMEEDRLSIRRDTAERLKVIENKEVAVATSEQRMGRPSLPKGECKPGSISEVLHTRRGRVKCKGDIPKQLVEKYKAECGKNGRYYRWQILEEWEQIGDCCYNTGLMKDEEDDIIYRGCEIYQRFRKYRCQNYKWVPTDTTFEKRVRKVECGPCQKCIGDSDCVDNCIGVQCSKCQTCRCGKCKSEAISPPCQ